MNTKHISVLGAAAFAILSASVTFGDDLNSPPWRGDPGSTVQHWGFDSQPSNYGNIGPESSSNPYGSPSIDATVGPFTNPSWHDSYLVRDRVLVDSLVSLGEGEPCEMYKAQKSSKASGKFGWSVGTDFVRAIVGGPSGGIGGGRRLCSGATIREHRLSRPTISG